MGLSRLDGPAVGKLVACAAAEIDYIKPVTCLCNSCRGVNAPRWQSFGSA